MSGWNSLEINTPDLGIGTLKSIIDKIKDAINTLVEILEFILKVTGSFDDPLAKLIKKLIDELKETVESFLDDTGAYVLHVPIRKRFQTNFLGLGDVTPSWAGELGVFGSENSQIDWTDAGLNSFLADANRYNGGNVGFFKTIIESLQDAGDINRPQFDDDEYVGGVVLVMGTDFDPLGFLDDIWALFGMFGDSLGADTVPKTPRPKNLKGYTIKGLSDGKFDTMLTWDVPDVPVYTLQDLGGIVLYPERYAVIRGKNSVEALGATTVVSLLGKRDLNTGDTNSSGNIEVLLEDEYDFTKVTYMDKDVESSADDAFYYAVAWKLRAFGADEPQTEGNGTLLDYWYISNVVRLTPFPSLPDSTPPNWHRTPSVADIFPPFAQLLRRLVAQIEAFSAKLLGASQLLQQYVDFLKSEVNRYEAIINSLLDEVAKLEASFQLPNAGVYYRTFKGSGGNDFFITDLAKSLMSSTPDAPPFHRGDEYVTGSVIMAGGHENIVDSLLAGLSWIFGTPSSSSAEMNQMLSQLGLTISSIEEQYFNDDMTPTDVAPLNTTSEEATLDEVTFDEGMVPTSCTKEVPPEPTFGDNMEVIDDADA